MSEKNGIRVPDDPNCLYQRYVNSTVTEYYRDLPERDARVSQLQTLKRDPLYGFAHDTGTWGNLKNVYFVMWTEPRGEELDAIRSSH